MADPSSVAVTVAHPGDADLARAEKFTREPFVHPGEDPALALAPGTPRRRALDQALAELDAGLTVPSTAWRRDFSLLLGLERVLSEDEPKLADETPLSAHQVDALSGTLTALLAEALRVRQRRADGPPSHACWPTPRSSASRTRTSRTTRGRSDESPRSPSRGGGGRGRRGAAGDEDDDDDDESSTALPPRPTRTRTRSEDDVAAELEAELDRAEAEAPLADWDEERRARFPRTRSSSPSSPRTPTPPSASGSSTRPAPARRSPRSASSRPRAPAAS